MTPLLATLLLTPAAPVPKPPPPPQYAYSYLGVQMNANSDQLVIDPPEEGTPSHKAGLKAGDELVQIGKIRPTKFEEIPEYVIDLRPGTELYVEVRRNGEIVTARLVLGVRPDTARFDPSPIFLRRRGIPIPDDDR